MVLVSSMGIGCDLSPRKKSKVKILLQHTNHSQRKLAELAGVSKSAANKIKISLDQKQPLSPKKGIAAENASQRLARSGRLEISVCKTEKKSAGLLTQLVQEYGIAVSKRTVQSRLAEEGLIGHRPVK